MMRKKFALVLALAVLSNVSFAREPFKNIVDFSAQDETEIVAWKVSELVYSENVKRGALSAEYAPLEAYLQSVLDKVYPEFKGRLKVRVFPDIGANAMAMPNGDIYVGGGMLTRMTSEAQLAALLGHEAAHVLHRHGAEGVETHAVVTGAISIVKTAIQAVPLPTTGLVSLATNPLIKMVSQYGVSLTAMSSIYGFSRAREREADEVGFARMVAAGYDPREAAKLFEALALEAAVSLEREPFFFASHPALESRIESFKELASNRPTAGTIVGADEFEAQVRPYRVKLISRELKWLQHRNLVAYFNRPEVAKMYGPGEVAFYLGDARRRQGIHADVEMAPVAFRRAIVEGYPADRVMEPLILTYLRLKRGAEAKAVIAEWIAMGKSPDGLDVKEYEAQASKLLRESE